MRKTTGGRTGNQKRFGQHFLEPAWVQKVVRAINPDPGEDFVEIGPGRGALTLALAGSVRRLVACEIDRELAARLEHASIPQLTVIQGDFLDINALALDDTLRRAGDSGPLRVVGNLPYNVASPILFKLIELRRAGLPIRDASVMMQHEVAERLVAPPGGRDYGVLTILIHQEADVERLLTLPPGAFRPVPRVRSALVRLRFRSHATQPADQSVFESLVQAVFTRRRKMLSNALQSFATRSLTPREALTLSGLTGTRRPETLSFEEFVHLANVYTEAPPLPAPAKAVL